MKDAINEEDYKTLAEQNADNSGHPETTAHGKP